MYLMKLQLPALLISNRQKELLRRYMQSWKIFSCIPPILHCRKFQLMKPFCHSVVELTGVIMVFMFTLHKHENIEFRCKCQEYLESYFTIGVSRSCYCYKCTSRPIRDAERKIISCRSKRHEGLLFLAYVGSLWH